MIISLAAALAPLICAATASTGCGGKRHVAVEFKAVHMKIDFNRLGFFKKLFVYDVLVTVYFKFLIGVGGLIQSHGQAGAASAAFI